MYSFWREGSYARDEIDGKLSERNDPAKQSSDATPVPITVEMVPFAATCLMRLFPESEINSIPELASPDRALGELTVALVAGPPSPEKPATAGRPATGYT